MASGTIRPEWVTPNNPTINLTNIESENTDIKVRSLNGLICFQGTLRIKQNVAVNGVLATDCPLPALASAWIFMMGATTGKVYRTRVVGGSVGSSRNWIAGETLTKATDEYYYVDGVYTTV